MRFFKRPKNEEEEYDEGEENPRSRRRVPKDKEFKDLKPENRRKRKEPKKPWGKKERLLVLSVVLATAGTSAVLAMSSRAWKLPGLPRIKVPSFPLPMFGGETIVIEGNQVDQVSRADQEKSVEIIRKFKDATRDLSGVYGLYVVNLENGFSYGVNEAEIFEAASLIKLPVMVGVYMEAEEGRLSLNSKYKLGSADKVSGAGSLYNRPVGYEVTYGNLVQLMGKQSDNTAFNIARKILGDDKINEIIHKIGMTNTSLSENETTPRDVGVFFEGLWKKNIVSEEHRDEILDSLTNTIFENWLAAGVPNGVRVAHKYGKEVNVVNDAGIIFTDKPFVVVIMSKGVVEKEADKAFPELARIVYEVEAGN